MDFTHLFAADMAAALNISAARVLVESVVPGSLIVNFKILGSPTELVTPDILADTFKSPGEIIEGLASTAAILAGEIMETAQAGVVATIENLDTLLSFRVPEGLKIPEAGNINKNVKFSAREFQSE